MEKQQLEAICFILVSLNSSLFGIGCDMFTDTVCEQKWNNESLNKSGMAITCFNPLVSAIALA